jgi:energy-coupling factor transporter transmembrane protein EcfT
MTFLGLGFIPLSAEVLSGVFASVRVMGGLTALMTFLATTRLPRTCEIFQSLFVPPNLVVVPAI